MRHTKGGGKLGLLGLAITLRGPGVILCKVTKNIDGKDMRIRTHTGAPDLACALYGQRVRFFQMGVIVVNQNILAAQCPNIAQKGRQVAPIGRITHK